MSEDFPHRIRPHAAPARRSTPDTAGGPPESPGSTPATLLSTQTHRPSPLTSSPLSFSLTGVMRPPVRLRSVLSPCPSRPRARVRSGVFGHRLASSNTPKPPPDPIPVPSSTIPIPLWQRLGPLTSLVKAYARAQRTRPYTTQLCSAVVIFITADVVAQGVSDDEYEASRTLRAAVIGAVAAIPQYHW